jgi:hypothetical protein
LRLRSETLCLVAADTAEDIAQNNAMNTSIKLMDVLQKYAKIKSTPKVEFKVCFSWCCFVLFMKCHQADRIIIFGLDLYTAKNIVASLLINDGVPDGKARNVLLR